MGAMRAPTLVQHFDGGAEMVLPHNIYFQEPRIGLMCLAGGSSINLSIIGNEQQQNMLILSDVRKMKFSSSPTHCDRM